MRKVIGLTASVLLMGMLAGCSTNKPESSSTSIEPAPAENKGSAQSTAGAQQGVSTPSAGSAQPGSSTPSVGTPQPGSTGNTPASSVITVSGSQVGLPFVNDAYQITEVKTLASARVIAVKGKLRAFEAVGAFAVKSADGKLIKLPSGADEGVIRASKGAPEWGDFTVDIPIPQNLQSKRLTLEFFVHSAKDGSRQQLLSFTVLL